MGLWGRFPAASLAVLCTMAIGCGGGAKAERTLPVSSLSEAKFVERADAICAEGRERGLRYQPSLPSGQTGAAIAEAIDISVLPALRQAADALYRLGAPAGRHGKVEAFLASFEEALGKVEDLEVPSFERLEPLLGPSGDLALRAGLESCGYG